MEQYVPPYLQQFRQGRSSPLSYVPADDYLQRFRQSRKDPHCVAPSTTLRTFPRQGNEGLYGFTLRLSGIVYRREDLTWIKKIETDLHESGHTNDEYETRRRTEEKMKAMFPEKEKYQNKPKPYQS